jgi:hypothetical protein
LNPATADQIKGKVGELIVQIRFLEHNIQAAPPIIDSGNDLVALRGRLVRSVQVKTKSRSTEAWDLRNLPEIYDVLALVELGDQENMLDDARIFLLGREEVRNRGSISPSSEFEAYSFTMARLAKLFG